jgi:hypothetical protein
VDARALRRNKSASTVIPDNAIRIIGRGAAKEDRAAA